MKNILKNRLFKKTPQLGLIQQHEDLQHIYRRYNTALPFLERLEESFRQSLQIYEKHGYDGENLQRVIATLPEIRAIIEAEKQKFTAPPPSPA